MALVGTGAAAMGVYLSCATVAGQYQDDPSLCLGGPVSAAREITLLAERNQAIQNVRIDFVSGANGTGIGSLQAIDGDTLAWTPPGASTAGASVAIANGETRVLVGPNGYAECYIEVTRLSALDMLGAETIQLLDIFNNAVGGPNTSAAVENRFRCVYVQNDGATDLTDVLVWLNSANTGWGAIGTEASPAQVTAETIMPSGVIFSAPTTAGAALSLGTIAAGASVPLWIERASGGAGGPAAAWQDFELNIRYTFASVTYTQKTRGLGRVYDTTIEGYELYWKANEQAIPGTDSPLVSAATLPITEQAVTIAPSTTYYVDTYYRNRYDILSLAKSEVYVINGDGASVGQRPSAPTFIDVSTGADGVARVRAVYFPAMEGETIAAIQARRANQWLVYVGVDADPDPDVDMPEVIDMDYWATGNTGDTAREYLDWSGTTEYLDATPLHVLVRTRRRTTETIDEIEVVTEVDSDNTTITEYSINRQGAARARGHATIGDVYGMPPVGIPTVSGEVVIDAGTNTRWILGLGDIQLWVDTALIWRAIRDGESEQRTGFYLPEWSLKQTTVTGAGTADPVEVVSAALIYLCVSSVRKIELDVTNKRFKAGGWQVPGTVPDVTYEGIVFPRYAETVFLMWNDETKRYESYATVKSDGMFHSAFRIVQTKTQAEILAI